MAVSMIKASTKHLAKAIRKESKNNPKIEEHFNEILNGNITQKAVRKVINAEEGLEIYNKKGKLTFAGKNYIKEIAKELGIDPKKTSWRKALRKGLTEEPVKTPVENAANNAEKKLDKTIDVTV